ncbi:hypothetical protein GGR54DRAFT_425927 [Hypoxylon sp. NC1633]|nr:hypothetical protein GGR54DRAFT_425927 [Hypoxylon sp. NC1633]
MEPSSTLDLNTTWDQQKQEIVQRHWANLTFHNDLHQRELREIREASERSLRDLREAIPEHLYRDTIKPMADKALKLDLQQKEDEHRQRTVLVERSHREELSHHEVSRHEKLKVALAMAGPLPTATGGGNTLPDPLGAVDDGTICVSQKQDVSNADGPSRRYCQSTPRNPSELHHPNQTHNKTKPLTCTVKEEVVSGERRLLMRVQSKKRKASMSRENSPKRLHVDSSVNPLRTPVATPIAESAQPLERTITFDEVFQDGKAKHKDTIVEWPVGSNQWYILKCEKHGFHFKKRPIQGAAKHLSGMSHGFPDRNWDVALRTLGYRVVDCTEKLMRLNNQVAEEAYAKGYVLPTYQSIKRQRAKKARKDRQAKARKPAKLHTADLDLHPSKGEMLIPEESAAVQPREHVGTPSSGDRSSDAHDVIVNPKTFHIYYGYWKAGGQNDQEHIYPVMILGWDDQTGSGLKDTDLQHTGLLKKTSHPPSCYIYKNNNKIVGWADGYEDGGPKIQSRKFPVMFFDEAQTVAWLPARDLARFPLYQQKPPPQPDHPFNAARRWIAEREGFDEWEDREQARIHVLLTRYNLISCHSPPPNRFTHHSSREICKLCIAHRKA